MSTSSSDVTGPVLENLCWYVRESSRKVPALLHGGNNQNSLGAHDRNQRVRGFKKKRAQKMLSSEIDHPLFPGFATGPLTGAAQGSSVGVTGHRIDSVRNHQLSIREKV